MALSVLVIGLDLTVLNTALPTLAGALQASTSQLQWFMNAYTLVLAAALLPAGALSDGLGPKRLLLAALALFAVACLGCGLSDSPQQLIGWRAVLGAAAAVIMPVSMSLLTHLFAVEERQRAMGVWLTANAVGMPIGPLFGGWILDHAHWSWVFYLNLPVTALAAAGAIVFIPRLPGTGGVRIDVVGATLSSGGLVSLTYGLIEAGQEGWGAPRPWWFIGGGIVVLVVFVLTQRRIAHPLIDLGLFREPGYRWGIGMLTVGTLALMGMMFVLPQYFQSVRGVDAFGSGARLVPMILGLMVGARLADPLTRRLGVRFVVGLGLGLICLAALLGATSGLTTGWMLLYGWTAVAGLGMGLCLPTLAAVATEALDPGRSGAGSAVLQAVRQVGGTLGVAVLGSVLGSTYRDRLDVSGLPAPAGDLARDGVQGALAVSERLHLPGLASSAREAFVAGMAHSLLFTAAFVAVCTVVGLSTWRSRGSGPVKVGADTLPT